MASAPDQLTLKRHRDLVGRERRPFARWAVLALLGLLCLEDLDEPVWAGVVPMRVAYDDPVDAPDLGPGRPVPPHVRARVTPPR